MIKSEQYSKYMVDVLQELLAVDSPTGFSKNVNQKLTEILNALGYTAVETNKRLVKVSVKGKSNAKKFGQNEKRNPA